MEDLCIGGGADFFEERIQSLGNFRFKGCEGPQPELGAIAFGSSLWTNLSQVGTIRFSKVGDISSSVVGVSPWCEI